VKKTNFGIESGSKASCKVGSGREEKKEEKNKYRSFKRYR